MLSLEDFRATMDGHAWAFQQLGIIDRDGSFGARFAEWLYQEKGQSGAAGWAYAVEQLALAQAGEPVELFFGMIPEFLSSW